MRHGGQTNIQTEPRGTAATLGMDADLRRPPTDHVEIPHQREMLGASTDFPDTDADSLTPPAPAGENASPRFLGRHCTGIPA